MKIYKDWSPTEVVKKLQSSGRLGSLVSSLRESLVKHTGNRRGAIAVAICGEEDVIALKHLGYNSIWIAFPTEEEGHFTFFPIDSTESELNSDEIKSVKAKVLNTVLTVVEKEGPFQDWRVR